MSSTFHDLADDVLIYIIAFFSVPDIFLLRQTCKRFSALTRLHMVWTNVFKLDILTNDYPFPLNDIDLERYSTLHAYGLATRWLAGSPLTPKSETTCVRLPVSEIKFQKCSEWSPEGAIFTGVKLNMDPESEAGVAVSLSQRIVLICLDDNGFLHEIRSVNTDLRPLSMTGDIMALDDDVSKTLIYNWRTAESADLGDVGDTQYDHCLQVTFTPPTILVVRARCITLYTSTFTCISIQSFGWVDGACPTPTSNLIRSQTDNPWSSELNSLELYSLSSFPPPLVSKILSRRGALRCTDVILDTRATAVWIFPHDRAMVSHWEEHDGCETLIALSSPFRSTVKPKSVFVRSA
ncbi:hypothetical protein EV421DRAFT_1915386 [Armillaria borealis]|uniref:F-box domain-containing protein n=1 Tax=Armillaria borealis TaxID=47425 RepID=A0AA39ICA2_9AGAR|nr:hypothetical protein EV421DRAFT_1915386 [Armillaria borealis]